MSDAHWRERNMGDTERIKRGERAFYFFYWGRNVKKMSATQIIWMALSIKLIQQKINVE